MRVVGFLEYGSALRYFDELLRTSSADELQAMDEIVAARPEFAVHGNIARRVRRAPSSLAEVEHSASDKFEHRGLPWVIALARVEMGGMLGTFVSHQTPFEAVGPSKYEMQAYQSLLRDGAQTHYWALFNDPQTRRVVNRTPGPAMLAYLRRLSLARHFLFASVRSQANQMTPQQVEESLSQKRNLEQAIGEYAGTLQTYLTALNVSRQTSQSTSETRTFVDACWLQLRNEPKALAMGKATQTER